MYTQHFGLSEFPFNLTSDPRFFYGNRVYQEALTGVRYGIKLRHGLIVLTGETGTGKTSLVRFVKERCESNIHPVVISNPPAEFSALLRLIMVGLGLPEPAADRSAAIEDLKRFLKEQLEKNHVAAVLIDEAQDLDAAALREIAALSELRWDNSRLLQIVLVGRRELETSLNRPELHSVKESAALWCRLEPLRTDEIAAYIDRRLARAGYKGKGLFERAAVEQIAVYSAGIPGQINVICDNALLSAYAASQKTVSLETVHKVFHTVQFRGACEVSPAFVEDDVEARLAAEEEPPMSETDREPHRPDDEKRHLRWPTPRKPGAASLFSLSTLAAAAGILFLAAAAGMLYIDHNEVSRANPSEEGSTRQEPSHPLGIGGSAGAVVYPDVAHEDQAASPSENGGGLHAMSSPAESSEPQKQDQTDPVVYVHVSQERDWLLLEDIGAALRDNGYSVPVTRYARERTQGDVRFFFLQDRREAERIKSVVESELGRRGYPMSLELLERDGKRFEFAAPGKIEVWLPPLRSAQS